MTTAASVLEHVVEHSGQLSAWGLAIIGAAVAAVAGTSHRRPLKLVWRLPYLLFVPGLACVGYSMYRGNSLVGHYLASLMVEPTVHLGPISLSINNAYDDQRIFLLYGLMFFVLWLFAFLANWIFVSHEEKE
jgi:hypothetical protein